MNTLKITVGEVVKEYAEGTSFETIIRLPAVYCQFDFCYASAMLFVRRACE